MEALARRSADEERQRSPEKATGATGATGEKPGRSAQILAGAESDELWLELQVARISESQNAY